jgi:peptidyl-prolyl cis-trans isomerase A (cyclophilin A)
MIKLKTIITVALFLAAFNGFCQPLPKAVFKTELGDIICEIDTVHAPVTSYNFLNQIKSGTFKNALFYRVVRPGNQPTSKTKIEVIQGGLYSDELVKKYQPIPHETTRQTGLKHLDGTLSMARNEPGTASTEFFICVGNQLELDFGGNRNSDGQGFAAFGKVIYGMDIVKKIQLQKDTNQYLVEPVKILKMEIQ